MSERGAVGKAAAFVFHGFVLAACLLPVAILGIAVYACAARLIERLGKLSPADRRAKVRSPRKRSNRISHTSFHFPHGKN